MATSQMMEYDFTISGYTSSQIAYENSTGKWSIASITKPNKYAITNGTLPPFGTKDYTLSKQLGGGHVILNLNACDDRKQFNCQDGSCIPIESRCDSEFDCNDGDDEINCHMIDLPISYLSHVPGKMCLSAF